MKVAARNFPLEVYYLRNSDIPAYVRDGVVDIAIIGDNLRVEDGSQLESVLSLGFSKCRVSLAVPENQEVNDLQYFNGKRIATSYTNTLSDFLNAEGIQAEIHAITGSVEIAPNIGLADVIMDIVSSGNTLFKNGLKEVYTVIKSEAVLVKGADFNQETQELLDRLILRLSAVLNARNSRYVLMNVPNDRIERVSKLLPVLKSPTILPLKEEGWSSLHTVIDKEDFWTVIDALKKEGAEDILVAPIEKIVR